MKAMVEFDGITFTEDELTKFQVIWLDAVPERQMVIGKRTMRLYQESWSVTGPNLRGNVTDSYDYTTPVVIERRR